MCWRFIDLFGRLGLSGVEPHFVLSRFVSHHPISEEQIVNTLGRPIYAKIPRDEKVLEKVQLLAKDLWQCAGNSALTRSYEELARRLAAGDEDSEEAPGLMSRLLGVFGVAPEGWLTYEIGRTDIPERRHYAAAAAALDDWRAERQAQRSAMADGFQQLKLAVHNRLFETIDVSQLESLEPAMVSQKVTAAINDILNEDGRLLTDADRARLIEEIKNELLGLGPLEPLLRDDEITDILVNGPNQVYVETRRQAVPDRRAASRTTST